MLLRKEDEGVIGGVTGGVRLPLAWRGGVAVLFLETPPVMDRDSLGVAFFFMVSCSRRAASVMNLVAGKGGGGRGRGCRLASVHPVTSHYSSFRLTTTFNMTKINSFIRGSFIDRDMFKKKQNKKNTRATKSDKLQLVWRQR